MEEKQHELRQIRIDRTNIEKFKKMRTARPLKEGHVRSIEKLLREGGHFISPMAINRVSYTGEYRVIDGHHRLEAIGRVLKDIPDYSILTDFQIFYNLNEDEERKIFASESVGLKQTLLSRLYVEQEDYPIVKMLLSDFPIKIDYGQMHSNDRTHPWISLITLLTAHRTLHKSMATNLHTTTEGMKKVASLTESDYKTMVKFGEDIAIIGNGRFGPRTIFRSVAMIIIYRLWYLNCIERPFMVSESISRQKFVERFVKVLNNWPTVSDALHEANKTKFNSILVVKAEEELVNRMNHSRKTQKVISTYEAWK